MSSEILNAQIATSPDENIDATQPQNTEDNTSKSVEDKNESITQDKTENDDDNLLASLLQSDDISEAESDIISMAAPSRFPHEADDAITGDFRALHEDPSTDYVLESVSSVEADGVLDEEESVEEEQEEKPTIDRALYYEMHAMYDRQYQEEKMKNNFLQRRLADYYRKRRMDHVLKESQFQTDTRKKYEKLLENLEELNELSNLEEERIHAEIIEMKNKRNKKADEIKKLFERMQQAELEVGKELMSSTAGKGNLEKLVDRQLKRQRVQMANVIKMRLAYIKITNKTKEKEDALNALDNLGPDLHLIDYEQLKVDNRNYQDKLEEKENELIKLRVKCQNAMQILAHQREKATALDKDIETLTDRLDSVTMDYEDEREQLNYLKQERDSLRHSTNKLKAESGLLTKPKLLVDMENALDEVKTMSIKLERIKSDYHLLTGQVVNIRRNMAEATQSKVTLQRLKGDGTDKSSKTSVQNINP